MAIKKNGTTKRAARPARTMSPEHKAALAEGREHGRIVRRYLEALEAHRPRPGRKRTPESVRARLATIDERLAQADPLSRLQLLQERMNLENELAAGSGTVDLQSLEDQFVEVAAAYGRRKGITYSAWRGAGVPADVLRRAGVPRGGGS